MNLRGQRVRIATTNQGKLAEFRHMLAPLGCVVIGMHDLPDLGVEEDGATFEANAIKKAHTIMLRTGDMTLADDSGLEVDALGGAPGVLSARYAGVEGPDHDRANRAKLLHAMQHVTDPNQRTARFVCALAWCAPNEPVRTVRGTLEGQIGFAECGTHGFGYDALFWLPERQCMVAELTSDEKHAISHRGIALRAALREWRNVLT